MNKKQPTTLICVLMAGLLISSCGPGQLFGPMRTPTPLIPKSGQWEGGDFWKDHYVVRLRITTEGKILYFEFTQNLGEDNPCTMALTVDYPNGLNMNSDGSFYHYFNGSKEEEGFSGKFDSARTVSGIATQFYCLQAGEISGPSTKYDIKWQAKWVSDR